MNNNLQPTQWGTFVVAGKHGPIDSATAAAQHANPKRSVKFTHVPTDPVVSEYRGKHPDRRVLTVDGKCIYPDETLYAHARIARKAGYPELVKAQLPPFAETLLIVGSGLSALPLLPEIIERAKTLPVMALKGAHDWLIDNVVTPTYAVASDPQQSRHDCFKRLNDETIYLLASQMHPDTWDYVRGRKVIIWHGETVREQRTLPEWQGVPLVWGGSTTGLRALTLGYLLGFRNEDLYGFDSCSQDGVYKLDGTMVRDKDREIEVFVGEKRFTSLVSMVPQVAQLRDVLAMLPGIKVNAFGEGYFQEHLAEGKRAGWPV